MIPVEDATARMLSTVAPMPSEMVPISAARGRILAADQPARLSQPRAPLSAMDGYAVRAADVQRGHVTLRMIGTVAAGQQFEGWVGPGACVRIFTGAPLPRGTDTILIQEKASPAGDRILVQEAVPPGRHVRDTALDFRKGEVLLRAGCRLTARDIGLAAAMNVPWVSVRRQPRVALLANGNELVMPGEPMAASQIVSANNLALASLVETCGGLATDLGIVRDDPQAVGAVVAAATGTDLLITSGGVSVGEHDVMRQALTERGLEVEFWKIAMRPGKPLMFGRLGSTPVLGLPGNPVSALVCGLVFARPMIRAMLGLPPDEQPTEMALLGRALPANDERRDYLRSRLEHAADGRAVVTPFDVQDSSMLSRLADANCLVVRPPLGTSAARGDPVPVLRFPEGPLAV